MASPSTVLTLGYGNGNLTGSPSLVLTLGYGSSVVVTVSGPYCVCESEAFVPGATENEAFIPGAVESQGDCC